MTKSTELLRGPEGPHYPKPLQILLRPLIDAIQRLLKILDRIGDTEPQMALAICAECGSGQRRNSRILQQRVGQLLRLPARLLDVGESVERALGQPAGESLDLVEAVDEQVAAAVKFLAHFLRLALVAA